MAFTWPPRTTYSVKEKISQVLWVLKLEGDISVSGSDCAVRELMKRLKAHGVRITAEHGFRLMLSEMEGGKYGDLIVRKINGRRTHGISLYTQEMPPNWLPDAEAELVVDDSTPAETFSRQQLFEPAAAELPMPTMEPVAAEPKASAPQPAPVAPEPVAPEPVAPEPPMAPRAPAVAVPAAVAASASTVDAQFDLIAAQLDADLEELRRPVATLPRLTVKERVGQTRNLDDKAGVMNAILELVADLAVMVAGEPTTHDADVKLKERLADALEQTQRFRQRALDASESAAAKEAEIRGLRRQLADKDGMLARLQANVDAFQHGERVADDRMVKAAQKFLAEKPHDRRGESKLVYSTGG